MAEENKKGQGMKNQKGVTLISLTIYVIALTVIIAMLSVISTFFYKNVNDTQDDITPLTEFTNFNSYFTTDANTSNVTYLTTGESEEKDENYYTFVALVNEDNSEIIKYIYVKQDKVIYRDTGTGTEENDDKAIITVARNVNDCKFQEQEQLNNNKTKFKITLKVGNNTKDYTYSLDND